MFYIQKKGKKGQFEDDGSKCDVGDGDKVSTVKVIEDFKDKKSDQIEHKEQKNDSFIVDSEKISKPKAVSDKMVSSQQTYSSSTQFKSIEDEFKTKDVKQKKKGTQPTKDEKQPNEFKGRTTPEDKGHEKAREQWKDSEISKQMSNLGIAETSDISRVKRDQLNVRIKRLPYDSALYFRRDNETQASKIASRHVNQILIRGDNVVMVSIAQEVRSSSNR